MANPDPNRSTRFQLGQSGNPRGKPPGPERMTILRSLPAMRSREQVLADATSWSGSAIEWFDTAMRDSTLAFDTGFAAAAVVLRHQQGTTLDAEMSMSGSRAKRGRRRVERGSWSYARSCSRPIRTTSRSRSQQPGARADCLFSCQHYDQFLIAHRFDLTIVAMSHTRDGLLLALPNKRLQNDNGTELNRLSSCI
jgi:hypothetical protein